MALRSARAGLAPVVEDRHRRRQVAVAEHRALRQSGGAAGILQQGDVIDRDRRPLRRFGHAVDEAAEGDDGGILRQRRLRRAGLAPVVVLANDQAVEQALVEKLQRRRQQRLEIAGDEHARAGIGELVRQRDLAVERGKMHDAGAGLQRAEEVDGVIGRVAEEQRHRSVLAVAGAQEGAGGDLDLVFQFGIADRTVAEFDRRPRAEFDCCRRQQIGQRSLLDRIVPTDALRIELLAGMHASVSPGSPTPPSPMGRGRG